MSTDQQPASYDPRYDGIYQRGGTNSTQQPGVQPVRHVPPRAPDRDPLQSDPRNQVGADHRPPSSASASAPPPRPPSSSPAERQQGAETTGASDPPMIRDVGSPPEAPAPRGGGRNPFDVWVWAVAAALTALGVCFLTAPILGAEAYAEQMMSQSGTSMYTTPWWQHTQLASLPLILLGVGTAVTQLFVLSVRHTLRTSSLR